MFHYIYHDLLVVNNVVRDIRASGTASETTEGINKPCHVTSQTVDNKKKYHIAELACVILTAKGSTRVHRLIGLLTQNGLRS
jgi:hypothetical protein